MRYILLGIAVVLLFCSVYVGWYSHGVHENTFPSIIATSTVTNYQGIITITLDRHLQNRLDALDGGKERRWDCKGTINDPYSYNPGILLYDSTGEIWYPFSGVVKTIGGETPKQLGYVHCTEISETMWSITNDPINP